MIRQNNSLQLNIQRSLSILANKAFDGLVILFVNFESVLSKSCKSLANGYNFQAGFFKGK